MKIIISPSKTLKEQPCSLTATQPMFLELTEPIKNTLLNDDPAMIEKRMHVSSKLAQSIYDGLRQTKKIPALYYYTGTVFKQLELSSYTSRHHAYLSEHLYILDALYGCLRYLDEISFYRLDYLCQIDGINLYDYWDKAVNKLLQKEDFIISLASGEYAKQVKHPNLITIDFAIRNNEQLKRPSMLIKKARGSMLNYLIKHEIRDLEKIKEIILDDFHYSPIHSTSSRYVFIKD